MTHDGGVGVVLEGRSHGTLHFTRNRGYRDKRSVVVYAVLMESGEVRFFTADALRDPNTAIPRGPALTRAEVTAPQTLAVVMYSAATVFAIFGPAISAVRLVGKHRASKSDLAGMWSDPSLDPQHVRAEALRDAGFGLLEFGFIALGVVLASIGSILLVIPS